MRPKKRELHELPYTENVNPGLLDSPVREHKVFPAVNPVDGCNAN